MRHRDLSTKGVTMDEFMQAIQRLLQQLDLGPLS
jgi:hypothetical protein